MTSILNLPATYAIEHGIFDYSMLAKYRLTYEGRFVGVFLEKHAAEGFARWHSSSLKMN